MRKKLILLSLLFISLFGCTNTNSSLSDNISNNNSISSSSISSILSTTSIEDNKAIITFNTEDKDINNWFICSNDINFKLDNDNTSNLSFNENNIELSKRRIDDLFSFFEI